jgi:hypothetical protein
VFANTEMQSNDLHAGTVPRLLSNPRVGFHPISSWNAAGTRPEPAVSVPKEKAHKPAATEEALPELDPPGRNSASTAFRATPYGLRVPTRPVANWSRFAFAIGIAPAALSSLTTSASLSGT